MLSRRQWAGATGWAPELWRKVPQSPVLTLSRGLQWFSWPLSWGVWEPLRHWSPPSEQLRPRRRSPVWGRGGRQARAPPWSFSPLGGARGGASALSESPSALHPPIPLVPWPWCGLRMDPAPSYYLLESPAEEGWQVPPLWLPVSLDWAACPPQAPPPARHTSCSCPVPSFVFGKKRVVINPEMDVFSVPLAASFFRGGEVVRERVEGLGAVREAFQFRRLDCPKPRAQGAGPARWGAAPEGGPCGGLGTGHLCALDALRSVLTTRLWKFQSLRSVCNNTSAPPAPPQGGVLPCGPCARAHVCTYVRS